MLQFNFPARKHTQPATVSVRPRGHSGEDVSMDLDCCKPHPKHFHGLITPTFIKMSLLQMHLGWNAQCQHLDCAHQIIKLRPCVLLGLLFHPTPKCVISRLGLDTLYFFLPAPMDEYTCVRFHKSVLCTWR